MENIPKNDDFDKKDSLLAGMFFATALITIVIAILFIWAPASYLLEKWNNYWEYKDYNSAESTISNSKAMEAREDCVERASNFFKDKVLSSLASSTSSNFETYDCYGIEYKKIPNLK